MLKGFYNLTSAMLTHQQHLNVIGNNMANISTAGYKQDTYTATTFDDVMYARVGNKDGVGEPIGRQSYIRAASRVYTDHGQGTLEPTSLPLDFAINGEGYFAVNNEGQRVYTRMGNFSLDEEGYLCLPGYGRVLDVNGQEIHLVTDKIRGDGTGRIYYENDEQPIARLGVFTTEDTEALEHTEQGFFTGNAMRLSEEPQVLNGFLERSNTDMVKQMTDMITVQRALQSAAQISKMYDQLIMKAATDVGRM